MSAATVSSLEYPVALALGVASHLLYFHRGEHFSYPWRYVLLFLAGVCCVALRKWLQATSTEGTGHGSGTALAAAVAQLSGLYLTGLYSSVCGYRLFLNPLNRFPGPFWARLTKEYIVYLNWQSGLHGHHVLQDLHSRYGPYVRIGPNDMSIVDPAGVKVVLGANSSCTKSAWYGQDLPYISTNTTRDRGAHDRRRRLLTPSFTDASLWGYAVRAQKYNDLLIERIRESAGRPMDVSHWFCLHGFDTMGDIVFNQSFGMLEAGETHWALQVRDGGLYPQGFAFPPWLYRIFATLPGMGADYRKFVNFTGDQLERRMAEQGNTTYPDIMHPLIDHYLGLSPQDQQTVLPMLQGDARMLIVGGSDASATTMIHIFYRLCSEHGLLPRLREELDRLVQIPETPVTPSLLKDAELLHGCINETLRLHYPAPSGFFRKTPPEGVFIGKVHVPGDTVVQLPPYIIGLDENVYERPREFIPERWSSKPEMVKQPDAFMPFLAGSESCIGKKLAYMQIATLTAQIIRQFDVAFALGEDGTHLTQGSMDLAMMHPEKLNLVFTGRSRRNAP